jgi:hypothetical protein
MAGRWRSTCAAASPAMAPSPSSSAMATRTRPAPAGCHRPSAAVPGAAADARAPGPPNAAADNAAAKPIDADPKPIEADFKTRHARRSRRARTRFQNASVYGGLAFGGSADIFGMSESEPMFGGGVSFGTTTRASISGGVTKPGSANKMRTY